jgi:hypothetical protein
VAATVTTELTRTKGFPLTVTPVIENAPTVGSYAGNSKAVRVALATDRDMPFLGIFMGEQRISAEATAAVVGMGEHCALALDTRDVVGVRAAGNTTLDLNCGIMANSISATAVTAGGSSSVKASPVSAVGGVPASSNYATGTERFPYAVPQADPYAALANRVMAWRVHLAALLADRRGSSAMELVLISGVLFAMAMGVADMALAFQSALKLEQAAGRAAEWATAPGTVALNYAAMGTEAATAYGDTLSATPVVDTWLECNGTKASSFTGTCPAGQQIARYASVKLSDEYVPLFDFGGMISGDGPNGGFMMSGAATVRIQ